MRALSVQHSLLYGAAPYLAHAIVSELDVTLRVQQHVVQLQVPVHHT